MPTPEIIPLSLFDESLNCLQKQTIAEEILKSPCDEGHEKHHDARYDKLIFFQFDSHISNLELSVIPTHEKL